MKTRAKLNLPEPPRVSSRRCFPVISGCVHASSARPRQSALRSVCCGGRMCGAEPIPLVQDCLQIRVLSACNRCQDINHDVAEFPKAAPLCAVRHARKHGSETAEWRAAGNAKRNAKILRQ